MAFHIKTQLLARLLDVKLGVALDGLGEPVVAVHRRIVLQHIEDESLMDGLFHCIAVKWPMLHLSPLGIGNAKHLQRLVLRRGGEDKVTGIGQHLALLDDAVDLVLRRFVLFLARFAEGRADRSRRATALAAVGFVDDDGVFAAPVFRLDAVEHEGKGLHRGDDDLFLLLEEFREMLRL